MNQKIVKELLKQLQAETQDPKNTSKVNRYEKYYIQSYNVLEVVVMFG